MNLVNNTFAAFAQLNILIVGDVMIDRYLAGRVDRISPEAPVPIVKVADNTDNRLGGAANVALNLRALGVKPYLCSVIGDDQNGEILRALLPSMGLSPRGLHASPERVTTVKTRIMAQSQHLLRVDREDTHDLSTAEIEAFLSTIRDLLDQRDIHLILFQDYNKGVLSTQVIREIMLEAIKRDILTAVDPKAKNFWTYKRATLFKPNLREIQQQVDFPVGFDLSSLQKAAQYIRRQLDNQYTMITLGEKGIFIDDGKTGRIIPTRPRNIADVCGAGDTVISVAASALAAGLQPREMAIMANLAGGLVCEIVGVSPINLEQLQQEYQQLQAEIL